MHARARVCDAPLELAPIFVFVSSACYSGLSDGRDLWTVKYAPTCLPEVACRLPAALTVQQWLQVRPFLSHHTGRRHVLPSMPPPPIVWCLVSKENLLISPVHKGKSIPQSRKFSDCFRIFLKGHFQGFSREICLGLPKPGLK